jgi:hypothetical protein
MTKFVIYIIIIIMILLMFLYVNNDVEAFTNDEAVQNLASLYNASNFVVTNANITSALTANTANIARLTAPVATINNLTAPVATITNLTAPTATITNLTAPTATITNLTAPTANINNLTAPTANINNLTTPNLNVSGTAKFKVRSGVQPINDWDVGGTLSAVNVNDCANKCNAFPSALLAGFTKHDNKCYCKTKLALYNYPNTLWDTVIFF